MMYKKTETVRHNEVPPWEVGKATMCVCVVVVCVGRDKCKVAAHEV